MKQLIYGALIDLVLEIKESNRLKRYEIALKSYEMQFNSELSCGVQKQIQRIRSKLGKK